MVNLFKFCLALNTQEHTDKVNNAVTEARKEFLKSVSFVSTATTAASYSTSDFDNATQSTNSQGSVGGRNFPKAQPVPIPGSKDKDFNYEDNEKRINEEVDYPSVAIMFHMILKEYKGDKEEKFLYLLNNYGAEESNIYKGHVYKDNVYKDNVYKDHVYEDPDERVVLIGLLFGDSDAAKRAISRLEPINSNPDSSEYQLPPCLEMPFPMDGFNKEINRQKDVAANFAR